jgi:integrase/recombinase XerD
MQSLRNASIHWNRYPLVAQSHHAKSWLDSQVNMGLAPNTVDAYGRALNDFLRFTASYPLDPACLNKEHIAAYVRDLCSRSSLHGSNVRVLDSGAGLANATLQQRLTVVRLYYDYLIEEGLRSDNPVGRGRYTPGKGFGGERDRSLIPRYRKLPWIPSDDQWQSVLHAAKGEPLRNRVMLAFAYDAGLRREELCALEIGDIDPSRRLLRIRAETTKTRQERVVPYSETTSILYIAYVRHRAQLSRASGPLFLSESRRNRTKPISIWTWSKIVEGIAKRSGVHQFTTHTLRHLCLTDLARAGWDIHDIALFAGHRSIQTTLLYIHLSGRELAAKLERSLSALHTQRITTLAERLI